MSRAGSDFRHVAGKTIFDSLLGAFGFAAGMQSIGGTVGMLTAFHLKNHLYDQYCRL